MDSPRSGSADVLGSNVNQPDFQGQVRTLLIGISQFRTPHSAFRTQRAWIYLHSAGCIHFLCRPRRPCRRPRPSSTLETEHFPILADASGSACPGGATDISQGQSPWTSARRSPRPERTPESLTKRKWMAGFAGAFKRHRI
jgi:hypothetical protein